MPVEALGEAARVVGPPQLGVDLGRNLERLEPQALFQNLGRLRIVLLLGHFVSGARLVLGGGQGVLQLHVQRREVLVLGTLVEQDILDLVAVSGAPLYGCHTVVNLP